MAPFYVYTLPAMRPLKIAAAVAVVAVMAVVSAALLAQGSGERTKVQGFSDAGKATLSKQIADAVSRGDTPGVVEIVVNREGTLYLGSAGKFDVARNVPMPTNAIFQIASMTKPVTSVAIMMLLEQGKLKLDDPVSKYLPGYDNLQVITHFNEADATYETRPAKATMTIRHLLAHVSGIGYAFTNPIENKLTAKTKKGEWELPLLDDPGTKWNYSASTRVLGFIVEKVTGTPLEPWYQEHIFKPLDMTDTSYFVAADKQSRVPTNHSRFTGTMVEQPRTPIPSTPTPPFRGDGGLYSTVEDYSKFVRMLLNEGRLARQKF